MPCALFQACGRAMPIRHLLLPPCPPWPSPSSMAPTRRPRRSPAWPTRHRRKGWARCLQFTPAAAQRILTATLCTALLTLLWSTVSTCAGPTAAYISVQSCKPADCAVRCPLPAAVRRPPARRLPAPAAGLPAAPGLAAAQVLSLARGAVACRQSCWRHAADPRSCCPCASEPAELSGQQECPHFLTGGHPPPPFFPALLHPGSVI